MEGTAAKRAVENLDVRRAGVCGEGRMAGVACDGVFHGDAWVWRLQAVFSFELPPEVERFCRSILYIAVVS